MLKIKSCLVYLFEDLAKFELYHSSDNVGIVFDQLTFAINFAYNLITGKITNFANGAFEVTIKAKDMTLNNPSLHDPQTGHNLNQLGCSP